MGRAELPAERLDRTCSRSLRELPLQSMDIATGRIRERVPRTKQSGTAEGSNAFRLFAANAERRKAFRFSPLS